MPACPNCGTKIAAPSRMFSVIVEPKEGEHGLTERKVGMYNCTKCGTKFPTVIGRQHYLVVGEEQLRGIQEDVKSLRRDNEELTKKLQEVRKEHGDLEKALEATKKDAEIKQLATKLSLLEDRVAYLRKEKGELEQKVSKFR